MRYLITGATGFIGKALIDTLLKDGNHVSILVHKSTQTPSSCTLYSGYDQIPDDASFDVVMNLAGSPIDRRWTPSVKEDLINSRVETTRALVDKIRRLEYKPQVMISASAVGFYGDHHLTEIQENTPPNPSFTHDLCQAWEKEAEKVQETGVRLCIVRLGVVLGPGGGALKKILPPFRLGLGAVLGRGDQPFSWIHLSDVLKAFKHLINHTHSSGVYNFVAPFSVTYKEFAQALGRVLKMPILLRVPGFILECLFGEMARSLLLQGNRVIPRHLLEEGFEFDYPKLEPAFEDIIALYIS